MRGEEREMGVKPGTFIDWLCKCVLMMQPDTTDSQS